MVITDGRIPPDTVLLSYIHALAENLESLGHHISTAETVVLAELLLQAGCSFFGMIVRHLAEQVVGNVGIVDVMENTID